jgi:transposase
VMQSGNGWRSLASEFPPWQTVYTQFKQWEKTGIWDAIWAGFEQPRACALSDLQL